MFNFFKLKREGMKKVVPFEEQNITQQMETIGKLIARICSTEQEKVGGSTMSFKINDVTDKESGNEMGSVSIYWRKK